MASKRKQVNQCAVCRCPANAKTAGTPTCGAAGCNLSIQIMKLKLGKKFARR